MPDQSHSNWQYIPQYNGPIHFYDKSITTNHANMSNEPDIVDRLIAAQLPICFEAAQLITWIRQERDEARGEIKRLHCLLHEKEDADANNAEFRRTH